MNPRQGRSGKGSIRKATKWDKPTQQDRQTCDKKMQWSHTDIPTFASPQIKKIYIRPIAGNLQGVLLPIKKQQKFPHYSQNCTSMVRSQEPLTLLLMRLLEKKKSRAFLKGRYWVGWKMGSTSTAQFPSDPSAILFAPSISSTPMRHTSSCMPAVPTRPSPQSQRIMTPRGR